MTAPPKLPTTALSRGPCPTFGRLASRYLAEYEEKIRYAVALLDEEQLWWRPNERSNSVGNLLLHVTGNLSLWILAGLAGEPYERDRAGEFAADGERGKGELLARLADTVARCREVAEGLGEEALERRRTLQGYETDGLGALFHAVEHMSYHTGQILYITKQLLGETRLLELYPRHRGE